MIYISLHSLFHLDLWDDTGIIIFTALEGVNKVENNIYALTNRVRIW